ncbi:MAG: hypothetical protein LBR93_10860 [Treponema sp.]|jgi:predicted Holliday junction resolvase-like endonuclease|nr:hypothetical protein [Treponema sp.]
MIRFLLIVIAVLLLCVAALYIVARLQGRRAKKAEKETEALHGAFRQVNEEAARLRETLDKAAEAEERADAERTELARTSDSGLAGRANSLFLRDDGNGKPGRDIKAAASAGAGSAGNGAGNV